MNNKVWAHESFEVCNGIVWFVPYSIDFLCGYSLIEKRIVDVISLPGFSSEKDRYINVKSVNDNIIIVPSYGKYIHVYSIKCKKVYSYEVQQSSSAKYFQCVSEKNTAFVLPFANKNMIKIELKEGEIPVFDEVSFTNEKCVSCIISEGGIYGVNREDSILYGEKRVFDEVFHEKGTVFTDLVDFDKKNLVALDAKGKVYKFKKDVKEFEHWFDLDGKAHSLALCKDKLMIFPEEEHSFFWVYDLNENRIEKVILEIKDEKRFWKFNSFSKAVSTEEKVYVMSPYFETLLEISTDDLNMAIHFMKMPALNNEQKKMIVDAESKNGGVKENDATGVDLSFLLSYLKKEC